MGPTMVDDYGCLKYQVPVGLWAVAQVLCLVWEISMVSVVVADCCLQHTNHSLSFYYAQQHGPVAIGLG